MEVTESYGPRRLRKIVEIVLEMQVNVGVVHESVIGSSIHLHKNACMMRMYIMHTGKGTGQDTERNLLQ